MLCIIFQEQLNQDLGMLECGLLWQVATIEWIKRTKLKNV